jgi:hypothetical protein
MEYSTENWDKLVSLFNSAYDLILGFLGQFTMFELIVLGGLIYIIFGIATSQSITEERLDKAIGRNFDYIEKISFDIDAIKRELDSLAGHDEMTSVKYDIEELLRKVDGRDFSYEISSIESELYGLRNAIEELKIEIKGPFDINEYAKKFNDTKDIEND